MPNSLVKQNSGPAGTQHYRHFTRRCGHGFEIGYGLIGRMMRINLEHIVGKVLEPGASATTGVPHLAAPFSFGDNSKRQAHQRTNICHQTSIATGNHDHVILGAQTRHNLDNCRVNRSRHGFNTLKQSHLFRRRQCVHGIDKRVQATGRR